MTAKELLNLPEGAQVKIKSTVECADTYKKGGKLSFYNSKKEGKAEFNPDTNEIEIYQPFGIEAGGGVCYFFTADEYELR